LGGAAAVKRVPEKKAKITRITWLENPEAKAVEKSIGGIINCRSRNCEANELNLMDVWATRVLMRDKRDISKEVLGEYIRGARAHHAHTGMINLQGKMVCISCFRRCTGITSWAWRSNGENDDGKGFSQAKDGDVSGEGMRMRMFVKDFAKKYGCPMPDDGKIQIPVSTLTEFHNLYARASVLQERGVVPEEEMAKYLLTQQIAMQYRSFCRVVNEEFPYLLISKHKRFTKCTACSRLDSILQGSNREASSAEKEKARDEKILHHEVIGKERQTYYDHHIQAHYHDGVWSIIIDKMDQKKTDQPSLARDTKETEMAARIKVCITGVLIHGQQGGSTNKGGVERVAYWYLDEFMKDCNIVIHTLNSAIRKMQIDESKIRVEDRILYVQLDNASSENKNKYLFGYLGYLVEIGLLGEVRASFLPVGHTHEDVDAFFSYIAKAFRGEVVVRTLESFTKLIENCVDETKFNKAVVHRVKKVVEIKRLFKDVKVRDIRKDEFYCFKFIKNEEGVVELMKRRYMQKREGGTDPWVRDEDYNLSSVVVPDKLLLAPRTPLPTEVIIKAYKGPFLEVLGKKAVDENVRMLEDLEEEYDNLCQTCCKLRLDINEQQLVEVKEKDLRVRGDRGVEHRTMAQLVKEYYKHMEGGEEEGGEINEHRSEWSLKTLLGMKEDPEEEEEEEEMKVLAEAAALEDSDADLLRGLEEQARGDNNLGRGAEANEARESIRQYHHRWKDPEGMPVVGKMAMVQAENGLWWVAEVTNVFPDEEEVDMRWYGSLAVDNKQVDVLKGKYKKAWRSTGRGDHYNYSEQKPVRLPKKSKKGKKGGWVPYVQDGVSLASLGAHSFELKSGGALPSEVQNLMKFCDGDVEEEEDEGEVGELA
jgi:hypothetical protein